MRCRPTTVPSSPGCVGESAEPGSSRSRHGLPIVSSALPCTLRRDPALSVDAAIIGRPTTSADSAPDPLAFETQLLRLTDLCRQLARTLANLMTRLSSAERTEVARVLNGLRLVMGSFEEEP